MSFAIKCHNGHYMNLLNRQICRICGAQSMLVPKKHKNKVSAPVAQRIEPRSPKP